MNLPLVLKPDELSAEALSRIIPVDCRSTDDYMAGHLPGAIQLDTSLLGRSAPPANGLLPDQSGADALATAIGLGEGDHLVAYDNGGETAAARLVWVLHGYGFNDISWLDGGYRVWVSSGFDTDTVVHNRAGNALKPVALLPADTNVLDSTALLARLEDPTLAMLDVRSAAEFDGSDVRSARGGHIPGARHYVWTDALDEQKQLKPDADLQAAMQSLGVSSNKDVVVYCQTHQRSAVTYVMLKHLGFDNVLALDGAWSEWGNNDAMPVETGGQT